MAHTVLWRIIFISCLIPLISSRDCIWLHPKQEYLSKQILQTFNQMVGFIDCQLPNIDDLYNITQVEAATTVREEKAWERLQALLHYVKNLLDDCVSVCTAISSIKLFCGFFDSKCAHNMVHINIKKNLQLASHLSSTMRRRRLLK
uniref:Uncharacterized protein n=1 Tax=Leptobrachium leishanense TaxID=445787 RepID=A0A8C5MKW7_9ANUR